MRENCPPLLFRDNQGIVNTKIDSQEQIEIFARDVRKNSSLLLIYLWHTFKADAPLIWDMDLDIQTYVLDRAVAGDFLDNRCSMRVGPRRLKTTIFSLIGNIYIWMNKPSDAIMYITYGHPLINGQVTSLRTIMSHDKFFAIQEAIQKQDPEYQIFKMADNNNSVTVFANNLGGIRTSSKSGEGETAGGTANWLIMDDMHNPVVMKPTKTESEDLTTKLLSVRNKYDTLFKRRVVPGGFEFSIGHKMADGDLQDYLIKDKEWPVVSIPLVFFKALDCLSALDPRTEDGQILHNNMHKKHPEDLRKRMENQEDFYKLDLHSNLISNNVMFPVGVWRIKYLEDSLDTFVDNLVRLGGIIFNSWDHASTTNSNSKFTARTRLLMYKGLFYAVDVKRYKMSFNDMEFDFIQDCMQYPNSINVLENADNGRTLFQRHNSTEAAVWDQTNNPLRLVCVTTTGVNKKQRASFTATLTRQRQIILISADWNPIFIQEHLMFGAITDIIDSCSLTIWAIVTNRIESSLDGDAINMDDFNRINEYSEHSSYERSNLPPVISESCDLIIENQSPIEMIFGNSLMF